MAIYMFTLADMSRDESAVVTGLSSHGGMRRRLLDIGLIPGTRVECVGKSPLGDPAAYLIRGAVIALRSEDAENIQIRQVVK